MEDRSFATLLAASLSAVVALAIWAGNKAWERREARRLRWAQIADIQRALLAEVEAHVYQLRLNDLQAHRREMLERMEREPDFVVMVPSETHATIFRALLPQIHLLPGPVVEPVSLYYSQIITVAHLADDIRSDRYAGISPDRRAAIYGHFIEMKVEALRMGEVARDALKMSIERMDRPAYWFSSPAADPSAPGSEV